MRLYFGDDYKRSKPVQQVYQLSGYSYYYDRSKKRWIAVKDGQEPLEFKTKSDVIGFLISI